MMCTTNMKRKIESMKIFDEIEEAGLRCGQLDRSAQKTELC